MEGLSQERSKALETGTGTQLLNLPSFSFLIYIRGAYIASWISMGMGHPTEMPRSGSGSMEGRSRKEGEGAWTNVPKNSGDRAQMRAGETWSHVAETAAALSPLTRTPQERSLWTPDPADELARGMMPSRW